MCISKGIWSGAQVQGNAIPPDTNRAGTALWQSPPGDFNFIHNCFEIKLAHSLLKTGKNQCLRACSTQYWSQSLSKKSELCSWVHIILEWQRWNSCYLCSWRERNERQNVTAFTASLYLTDTQTAIWNCLKLSVHWGKNECKAKTGIQTAGEHPRTWSVHKGRKTFSDYQKLCFI